METVDLKQKNKCSSPICQACCKHEFDLRINDTCKKCGVQIDGLWPKCDEQLKRKGL
jgi:hypothetical protein